MWSGKMSSKKTAMRGNNVYKLCTTYLRGYGFIPDEISDTIVAESNMSREQRDKLINRRSKSYK